MLSSIVSSLALEDGATNPKFVVGRAKEGESMSLQYFYDLPAKKHLKKELEHFADEVLRKFAQEQEIIAIGEMLKGLDSSLKSTLWAFLKGITLPRQPAQQGLPKEVTLSETNIVKVFEAFSKFTSIIEARMNTQGFIELYRNGLQTAFDAAMAEAKKGEPTSGLSPKWEVKDHKFTVLPLLMYESRPVEGIYPVMGKFDRLGLIVRNAVAHSQVVTPLNVNAFCILYPVVKHYVDLIDPGDRKMLIDAGSGCDSCGCMNTSAANTHHDDISIVLVERTAVTRWLAGKFTTFAEILGFNNIKFLIPKESL
mmetsp:Transcript_119336/g.234434  ORF Transcript_119336/g.234434 Transcript_119336/m.234434 type:complete len:310 (+) Transcript_119336:47-976(+)